MSIVFKNLLFHLLKPFIIPNYNFELRKIKNYLDTFANYQNVEMKKHFFASSFPQLFALGIQTILK